ncbi:uncharacterized protein [Hyperolius riggenbachi]|uniref:uncharacterized protein isoform X2 n=1 Tax=Hyperolius riggenbachi TaxID=752182 RepID=UPI0035A39EBF
MSSYGWTPVIDGVTMESAKDGKASEGDEDSPSTSAADTTQTTEDLHTTHIKEDTAQQMLTCETGNTGNESSTPPCDNQGTAGQGLHGTSPAANDNPVKVQNASSASQLESHDEETTLDKHAEQGTSSSDESGDWETASEESIAYEEASDHETEKSPGGDRNMDSKGQENTEENCGDLLEKAGRVDASQPAEEAEHYTETTEGRETLEEQAFIQEIGPDTTEATSEGHMALDDITEREGASSNFDTSHEEEAGLIMGRQESEEFEPHSDNIIAEWTEPDVLNIRSPFEKMVDEESTPTADMTIGEGSMVHEDINNEGKEHQLNESFSEKDDVQVQKTIYDALEPYADKTRCPPEGMDHEHAEGAVYDNTGPHIIQSLCEEAWPSMMESEVSGHQEPCVESGHKEVLIPEEHVMKETGDNIEDTAIEWEIAHHDRNIGGVVTHSVENVSEGAEPVSEHQLTIELEGDCGESFSEESDNKDITSAIALSYEATITEKVADEQEETFNNKVEVEGQQTINTSFKDEQKAVHKYDIEGDEEIVSEGMEVEDYVGQLADSYSEGTSTKNAEDVGKEMVDQESGGDEENAGGKETECNYSETGSEHPKDDHKRTIEQGLSGNYTEIAQEEILGNRSVSDGKENLDDNGEMHDVSAAVELYNEQSASLIKREHLNDGLIYGDEMSTDSIHTAEHEERVLEIVDLTEMSSLTTLIPESEPDRVEDESENIMSVETLGRDADIQNNDFAERTLTEHFSEETGLAKIAADQKGEEICQQTLENLEDVQSSFVKESAEGSESDTDSAKVTALQFLKRELKTFLLADEASKLKSNEMGDTEFLLEASETLSSDLLDLDIDSAGSANDGVAITCNETDAESKIDIPAQELLAPTITTEDYAEFCLDRPETRYISDVKPIHMKPVDFLSDAFQTMDIDDKLTLNKSDMADIRQNLKDSLYMDMTDSVCTEQSSQLEESLNLSFQKLTAGDQEQVPGVIRVVDIVGSQSRIHFSELPEEHRLAQDDTDCFSQALVLESSFILPMTQPSDKPTIDEIFIEESALTTPSEPVLTQSLSHESPVADQSKRVEISEKDEHTEEERENKPKLLTRQRSNTDPCLAYGQGEKDSTQEDDQPAERHPRPRLRSVTPPLDQFTASFTAKLPQIALENKPMEPTQTSILYPSPDYNTTDRQEDTTPKKDHKFYPTQIFNPLFLIQQSTEESGFYQEKPVLPHVEKRHKERYPSPPRDTEAHLRGPQPPIAGGSLLSEDTSAPNPPTTQSTAPVWLPPRPLRHSDSTGEPDFRPLKFGENPLVRRPTIRQKRSGQLAGVAYKRYGAANLPPIPQQVGLNQIGNINLENVPRSTTGSKVQISSRNRPLPRQQQIPEEDVGQRGGKSTMQNLAEAEEHAGRQRPANPESVLRRGKRGQLQPPASDSMRNIQRRRSTLINASGPLYQEYSDVALNQEIQRQKPSPAEDKDPGSPRLRRRLMSSQDSYLQRLSISSADSLWQDLPNVRDSVTFMSMTRDEQKLQEAKFELIMSEALYLRSLNIAVDHFQHSTELQELLGTQNRQWLFSRLSEVRDASNDFLFDLEEEFENNMYNFQVCDVVLSHEPNFRKVYLPYVTNQTYQDRTFQRLMSHNPRFQQVLSKLESDPVCQRLSLKSFLILPFQRITRLRLLLQNIVKRSPQGSMEELQATKAHNAIENLIRQCNESVQKMKDTEELILLNQKIQFECKIFPLISASRRLIKHGEVILLEYNPVSFRWKGTTRPVYLHLFNDCLLLSRVREGGRFVVFDHSSEFRVERCEMKLHSNQKNIFRVFLRDSAASQGREGTPEGQETQYIFRTETQSQKLRWTCALSPPNEEIDFLRDHSLRQMQCFKSYKARENDELSLEKADILIMTQNSDDGWYRGVRLSDLQSGWFPQAHVRSIDRNAGIRNWQEEQRLHQARAKLQPAEAK